MVCKFLFMSLFPDLLGVYLRVELLGPMCNFLKNPPIVFHSSYTISHPPKIDKGSNFAPSSSLLAISVSGCCCCWCVFSSSTVIWWL